MIIRLQLPSQSIIEDSSNKILIIKYAFEQPVKKFLTDCFHNERLFFVHYVHSMNLTHKHTFENESQQDFSKMFLRFCGFYLTDFFQIWMISTRQRYQNQEKMIKMFTLSSVTQVQMLQKITEKDHHHRPLRCLLLFFGKIVFFKQWRFDGEMVKKVSFCPQKTISEKREFYVIIKVTSKQCT